MDLVSRLKTFLDSRQISVTQFADECGIPRPTGSQLLAGRNKKVSDEIIGKIHNAYPDLNVVWLMFGEGDMVKNVNIEISEPQNKLNQQQTPPQSTPNQPVAPTINFIEESEPGTSEKFFEGNQAHATENSGPTIPGFGFDNTFTFASPAETTQEGKNPTTPDKSAATDSITLTPGKGKRVTGIVVYYDDCTYESFIPDPTHSHPFMNR